MKVSYEYDIDPRYGWARIEVGASNNSLIIMETDNGSIGFTFDGEAMIPSCICSAWSASECCCPNVGWDN